MDVELPCRCAGTVEVDGALVPAGTEVSAWLYRGTPEEEQITDPALTGESDLAAYEYSFVVELEPGVHELAYNGGFHGLYHQ